jgi:hypothetical protein
MDQISDVTQQVAALRRVIHSLMDDKSYADTEIINASAVLDTQLEDYANRLREKSMPTIKSF